MARPLWGNLPTLSSFRYVCSFKRKQGARENVCDLKFPILISSHAPPSPTHTHNVGPVPSAGWTVSMCFSSSVLLHDVRAALLWACLGEMFAVICFPSDGRAKGSQPMLPVPYVRLPLLSPLRVQVSPGLFVKLCGNWRSGSRNRK